MVVKRIGLTLVFAAALALAGCAQNLDTGKIEAEIQKGLSGRTGAKIASVDCPDDVEAKKGDTFRCAAKAASGERVAVEVIQEDDEGSVRWRVVREPPT